MSSSKEKTKQTYLNLLHLQMLKKIMNTVSAAVNISFSKCVLHLKSILLKTLQLILSKQKAI